jgi:hypothetical protein
MADESHVVKTVDWKALFPFTLIFRTFRIAVHPSKLILALLAIFFIYAGGRALDWIWPEKYKAIPMLREGMSEIDLYTDTGPTTTLPFGFTKGVEEIEKSRQVEIESFAARWGTRPDGKPKINATLPDIKWAIKDTRNKSIEEAEKLYNDKKDKTDQDRHVRDQAVYQARVKANSDWQNARLLEKQGLFDAFLDYQLASVDEVLGAVRAGEWIQTSGVTAKLRHFLADAPVWAIKKHPVFFGICFLWMLAVWAIFGGAIARIAAVHVARDEKISIRQALRFSTAKFLSFFSAPLIPLLIMLLICLVMAAGGLLTVILPFVGPILVGVGFILFLIGGFLVTLVFFGWVGGSGLMYPTIAVEGSDSFDAISRSFSYLYARPWKLAFYAAVGLLYGSICFIFVRFFLFVLLRITERATGAWIYARETATGTPVFNVMFPAPRGTQFLSHWPNFFDLGPGQSVGALFIWLWVSLVVGMLGACAISFYFSAGTIIYMLLRNDVDATEMDDVYIDQPDEEFNETAPAPTAPAAVTSGQPVDVAAPPPSTTEPPADNPPQQQ